MNQEETTDGMKWRGSEWDSFQNSHVLDAMDKTLIFDSLPM